MSKGEESKIRKRHPIFMIASYHRAADGRQTSEELEKILSPNYDKVLTTYRLHPKSVRM